ncbi:MAG: endonuclease MutS2 [Bacteroidetes bacterium GWF2_38_335]|nr:MAG: endonuclease MutS2 [Bacteroidetes bacterium GWF2_38_335]OFY80456.1 MAG: endonuclease MutS2 [Bacteroidetes bacterium RIFOXYA12_FULL_38_20]HBS85939.1 endonuclease MutS2 [Bacteroidales bacterium]
MIQKNIEIKTGFDKIRELLNENCLSPLGQTKVADMGFLTDYNRIIEEVELADEFRTLLMQDENFPVNYFFDITPSLRKLKVDGTFLDTDELFNLKRSLDTIWSITKFFKGKTEEIYPRLKKLAGNVVIHKYILDRCDAIINKQGKIKDNASPELQNIRIDLASKQAGVSKKLASILKNAQGEGWAESDLGVTMVNGRMVIPVISSYKRKIKGLVHDESATGKTSYLEPEEIVEVNNEIRELEYAEKREIVRILVKFSDDIRPYLDDLFVAYDFLGNIDFIRARARLAIRLNAIKPAIINEPLMSLSNARHPLLYISFQKDGREVVPLTLHLDIEKRILLISGPNAGGKSVCLKTAGLLQYMLQCGLLVPVGGATEMGIFQSIFMDIGDEQSIENDLSTYSSHLVNMKFFLKNAGANTLVLIDEFGTGTEPMLGGAIAEAILGELNSLGTFGIITTHYTNLKHFAASTEGIENGAMLFDNQRMQPMFQLQMGQPGSSFAFEIAAKIGLPASIINTATEKVGQKHIDFDKHLRDVLRDKRYWENKRKQIKQQEKKLDDLVEKVSRESAQLEKEKKHILKDSKAQAEELLKTINKKIENTISEIRESQAEKEKTKQIRREAEEFKTELLNKQKEEEEKINVTIEKIKERQARAEERKQKRGDEPEKKETIKIDDDQISIGDKVKLKDRDTYGEIIDKGPKNMVVAFGNMITTIETDKLVKVSTGEYKKNVRVAQQSTPSEMLSVRDRKLNFKPHIDLRGKRAEEALQEVMHFIDEAFICDASEVKILHGKGNGVLRQLIRDYLRSSNIVTWFGDEHLEFGGAGITVVKFR